MKFKFRKAYDSENNFAVFFLPTIMWFRAYEDSTESINLTWLLFSLSIILKD